ncbi:hypothetical protein C2845_PM14G19420 [Panicum miliaceum]|uniref:Uncharacterized protein n=1 Tax=Panicum miliaceum TaxID=4540 RepID=A0A3L6PPM3_PANMI|nr:hypothetical protein C2845_PM14G19420 [Panicum miliaceum]
MGGDGGRSPQALVMCVGAFAVRFRGGAGGTLWLCACGGLGLWLGAAGQNGLAFDGCGRRGCGDRRQQHYCISESCVSLY